MRICGNPPINFVNALYLKNQENILISAIAVEPKARAHLALYEANEKLSQHLFKPLLPISST